MRTFVPYFSLFNSQSECQPDCKDISFGTETVSLPSSVEYKFTSCTWNQAVSSPGGAISSTKAVASLAVSACKFRECNSTSDRYSGEGSLGGAIFVKGIKSIDVDSSFFIRCSAPRESDNAGGGGVCMNSISSTITIKHSLFLSCFTGSSGAGVYIYGCTTTDVDAQTVNNCRFLFCTARGESPDGASGMIYQNSVTPGFSNCLFHKSEAENGGALYLDYSYYSDVKSFICFCFFNKNIATVKGNDICCYPHPSYSPLLQCFSTTEDNRIYPSGHEDWLTRDNSYVTYKVKSGYKNG